MDAMGASSPSSQRDSSMSTGASYGDGAATAPSRCWRRVGQLGTGAPPASVLGGGAGAAGPLDAARGSRGTGTAAAGFTKAHPSRPSNCAGPCGACGGSCRCASLRVGVGGNTTLAVAGCTDDVADAARWRASACAGGGWRDPARGAPPWRPTDAPPGGGWGRAAEGAAGAASGPTEPWLVGRDAGLAGWAADVALQEGALRGRSQSVSALGRAERGETAMSCTWTDGRSGVMGWGTHGWGSQGAGLEPSEDLRRGMGGGAARSSARWRAAPCASSVNVAPAGTTRSGGVDEPRSAHGARGGVESMPGGGDAVDCDGGRVCGDAGVLVSPAAAAASVGRCSDTPGASAISPDARSSVSRLGSGKRTSTSPSTQMSPTRRRERWPAPRLAARDGGDGAGALGALVLRVDEGRREPAAATILLRVNVHDDDRVVVVPAVVAWAGNRVGAPLGEAVDLIGRAAGAGGEAVACDARGWPADEHLAVTPGAPCGTEGATALPVGPRHRREKWTGPPPGLPAVAVAGGSIGHRSGVALPQAGDAAEGGPPEAPEAPTAPAAVSASATAATAAPVCAVDGPVGSRPLPDGVAWAAGGGVAALPSQAPPSAAAAALVGGSAPRSAAVLQGKPPPADAPRRALAERSWLRVAADEQRPSRSVAGVWDGLATVAAAVAASPPASAIGPEAPPAIALAAVWVWLAALYVW